MKKGTWSRTSFFDGYIQITKSDLYGIHVKIGRWMLARETVEMYESTKRALKVRAKEMNK